ncbi:MAG TPA: M28 family metallopeptidase [Patescibacteria group bacterium]|nr:M28 family metallopeptidase [Patescibacteria group bacterium]
MRRTISLFIGLLLSLDGRAEVAVLDIDRAGPAVVDAIKQAPAVRAWSELGSTVVVDADSGFLQAQQSRLVARLPVATIDALASRVLVHCNGSEASHDKHAGPEVLFEREHWQLIAAQAKQAGDEMLRPGRVVAYQQGNRVAKRLDADPAIAAILSRLRSDPWRRNVNTLATFNRQSQSGFAAAADWLQQAFDLLVLETSRQTFTVPPLVPSSGRNVNVLGLQRGRGQGTLIVGAHLDSRNQAWNDLQPSPGAEDNASGCAAVLETARMLRDFRFDADILYICYGLEERGLFGGRAHAAAQTPSQILGVINMDMIAFDGDGRLDVSLQATAPGFGLQQRLADNAARYTALEVEVAQQTCCSDHQPYLDLGIPAVLLIENDYRSYPQYHTVDDTAGRISDTMALEILKMAVATAAEVATLRDDGAFNGYWFDPAQSGHGFQIEVQDGGLVFLTWYTFDAEGNRLWVIATGTKTGDAATLNAHVVSGGVFPPAFNPAQVQVAPWGTFELSFDACDRIGIRWRPNASTGLPAGEMSAVRSSDPLGGGCDDD